MSERKRRYDSTFSAARRPGRSPRGPRATELRSSSEPGVHRWSGRSGRPGGGRLRRPFTLRGAIHGNGRCPRRGATVSVNGTLLCEPSRSTAVAVTPGATASALRSCGATELWRDGAVANWPAGSACWPGPPPRSPAPSRRSNSWSPGRRWPGRQDRPAPRAGRDEEYRVVPHAGLRQQPHPDHLLDLGNHAHSLRDRVRVYGHSKAFGYSFAESLREELRGTGVTVIALLPGCYGQRLPRACRGTSIGRGQKDLHRQRPEDDKRLVAVQGVDALLAGRTTSSAVTVPPGDRATRSQALLDRYLPTRSPSRRARLAVSVARSLFATSRRWAVSRRRVSTRLTATARTA